MYQHLLDPCHRFLPQNRAYNNPHNQDIINQFHGHPYNYTTSNIMGIDMNRRRCASASGHLNLYVQAKTIIHNGKFMNKMKEIREKYIGCIDKQQCIVKSYQKHKGNQQQQNPSHAKHKIKQQVKQIDHALQQQKSYSLNTEQKQKMFRRSGYTFQSPYNKLDHAEDTSPNTMRKNSPTQSHSPAQRTANISSSTTARKKPNKKQVKNKNTNYTQIPLKLQQKCYQNQVESNQFADHAFEAGQDQCQQVDDQNGELASEIDQTEIRSQSQNTTQIKYTAKFSDLICLNAVVSLIISVFIIFVLQYYYY